MFTRTQRAWCRRGLRWGVRRCPAGGQELAGVPDPPPGNFQSAGQEDGPGLLGLPRGKRECRTAPRVLSQGRGRARGPSVTAAPEPSSARSLSQRSFTRYSRYPAVPSHLPAPRRPPGRAHPQAPLPSSHPPRPAAPALTPPQRAQPSLPSLPLPLHFPLQPLGAAGIQVPRLQGRTHRRGPSSHREKACF